MRYVAAMLAMLLLLAAAVVGLGCAMTTEAFARAALLDEALLAQQQSRVQDKADELAATWRLSSRTLDGWTQDAARNAAAALCAWWGDLWSVDGSETTLPVYLDAAQERELIADVMADEGFIAATEASQRRAIARDDVAYGLDEAVCEAVLPLRRSVTDMALIFVAESVSLPLLRQVALLAAGALVLTAMLLLLMAHRVSGSALMATGVAMVTCVVPVILMDMPGMLQQLSPIAAAQGMRTMLLTGMLWLGTALVLALLGWLIVMVKRAGRRHG